ncbi:phosphatase PAP2 family protein [Sphingomonas sp. CGMCC 1.13654]|uniref:Phosphatase PAP2 family protein n=1 Tax=Sphingomonas chungangi TaxID=2683589 RepID=A0A838L553_9SPHN|nr:phosphatase PAP2 family protein [Sphingomonas chungangi]MBA2933326.1 phosphatase PAP2 family protein [Sphingomonas chungangi]MVW54660.1 inositol phosphorylceramide synthase [Sphingomonas chungangi]
MLVKGLPVEVRFTALMVAVCLGFSLIYRLPIRFPASGAGFVGVHYLLPLAGVLLFGLCAMASGRASGMRHFLLALPCYTIVLFVHFHLKLWAPVINPQNHDAFYWSVDQQLRPLVDACFAIRRALFPIVSTDTNLYMIGFILLFYGSFCYHALRTPAHFRTLFLAILFMQGLGALFYLAAPGVGPFLFEPGLNPHITEAQHYMYQVHQQVDAGGAAWLAANEQDYLMTGLGAMPSLHVGSSFVFLWFAIRHGRVLLPTYVPLFGYIVINAIASRWHYLIDLPAGLALAGVSIWLAHRVLRNETRGEKAQEAPRARREGDLVPA